MPSHQPKPHSAVCLQLPGLQHPVGNTRPLSSVPNPKVSCWCYFCFLKTLCCPYSAFFPLSHVQSNELRRNILYVVFQVPNMKFTLNFHNFCFPLDFLLVLLSYKQGKRFHSCEGLWYSWGEASPRDISASQSGANLETQLWKAGENCSLTRSAAQREVTQRNSPIITLPTEICWFLVKQGYVQRVKKNWTWCDLWSQKIISTSYMEGIPTLHNQPINEANPSLNMWHLKDCWVEIWCEHSISFLSVFFSDFIKSYSPTTYTAELRDAYTERFVNRAWKYMM